MGDFAAGLIIGLTIGAVIIMCDTKDVEQQVVAHHAAEYNATTGEVEWLDCQTINAQ